ncbi:glycosyltransferase family 39 protein [Cryobacterium tagatosivorans]|uniref:Glycosyltransferase RgtA/B/C/D-like domain-containing protein n=1 Tax=Cryobacterium tagatosivorans TaxID=1259199 RepID=A0A4R8UG00_9MICO|nr:glycosyltransferase family 39 protein [Cryobacterium tagatosivorans]TFB51246.1 hypothetical protein E3O23_08810 [Cryobacterium tagatosivorans]
MRIRVQDDAPRTSAAPPRAAPGHGVRTAALLGLLGFVVSFAGSWQPSFWGDEAASVMSAQRPLPSLFRMLGNVDAVHGGYYLFLHYWIELFGASELSVRLPSAIAVGAATAGTFVLARTLLGDRVALIAALIFAILPRVTYLGAEARSYALATAAAVWSTVLLVRALRPDTSPTAPPGTAPPGTAPRASVWAGYAALLGVGIILFADVILILPAHALAMLLLPGTLALRRRSLAPWCLATAAALVMAAPVLLWGFGQREQISFIQRRPLPGLRETAVVQWFGIVPLAILACALILLAVISVFAARRESAASRPNGAALAVLLAWLLVPTIVLVAATYLGASLYSARYLSFATPAVAIAMALGVASLRARWLQASWLQASVVLLAVTLALPTYLAQRGELAKNRGSDWRQASELLRAGARPGDAVLFDENGRPSRKPRLALHLYPEAFQDLTDVRLARPYESTDGLWDATVPLAAATDRLAGASRVWLLLRVGGAESRGSSSIPALERLGFRVAESTTLRRTVVIEMTR